MWLFSSKNTKIQTSIQNVALVTNFSSCALGMNLVHQLTASGEYAKVVAVSHNAN